MNFEDKVINFSEEERQLIAGDVHAVYNKVLKNSFKRLFTSKWYKIVSYLFVAVGFLLIIGSVASFFMAEKQANFESKGYFLLFIAGIIVIFTSFFLIIIGEFFRKQIKKAFNEYHSKFLQLALGNSFNDFTVNEVSTYFTLMPEKFVPHGYGARTRVWTENVIAGHINGQKFNCGSMMEKITEPSMNKDDSDHVYYNRYLYLTLTLPAQECVTTIGPETLLTQIKNFTKHNMELESPAFEKLFALDYSDPIKLRKLLVPKVMAAMTDLANSQNKVPQIYISKNQITVCFNFNNLASSQSPTANILNLTVDNDEQKLVGNVMAMLDYTLSVVSSCYRWPVALDLVAPLNTKKD